MTAAEKLLKEHEKWYTARRVAVLNRISVHSFDEQRLVKTSEHLHLEIQKAFDANDGEVRAFHLNAWIHEYPELAYA